MKNINGKLIVISILLTLLIGAALGRVEVASLLIKNANAGYLPSKVKVERQVDAAEFLADFSRDGKTVAILEEGGVLTLRDVLSGKALWTRFDSQNQNVTGLVISPDEKTLVSVGKNALSLWDVVSGQERDSIPLGDNISALFHIKFSSDGKNLAAVSTNNDLHLWHLASGSSWSIPNNQALPVDEINFSPDGRFLASVVNGQQSWVKLIDATTGRLHLSLRTNTKITDLAFSPDNNVLAVVEQNGAIKLWEPISGVINRIIETKEEITKAEFSRDGKFLAIGSGGKSPKIQLWNTQNGKLIFTKPTEGGAIVKDLVHSPNGRLLASIGSDNRVSVWSIPKGSLQQILTGQSDRILRSAFNFNSTAFATVAKDGRLIAWDLISGAEQQALQLPLLNPTFAGIQTIDTDGTVIEPTSRTTNSNKASIKKIDTALQAGNQSSFKSGVNKAQKRKNRSSHEWKGVRKIALSQDGLEMGAASEDGTLRIFKKNGKMRWRMEGHHGRAIAGLAFRGKTKEWVSAGIDTEIKLWDDATGRNLKTFYGPEHPPRAVVVSPNGQYIATAGEDTRILVYDAVLGKLSAIYSGHVDFVNGLAFSPDGKLLASAGAEGRILLWDVKTGKQIRALAGHSDEVNAVAFNPEGTMLASAGVDSTIKLWNPITGELAFTLMGHQGAVRTVAFSPNGNKLISAGEDGRMLVWDAKTGKLKKQIGGQTAAVNDLIFDSAGMLHTANENSEVSEFDTDTGSKLDSIIVEPATSVQPISYFDKNAVNSKNIGLFVGSNKTGSNNLAREKPIFVSLLNKVLDWTIPAANAALPDPNQGPGGPILVITSGSPTFGKYYAEILRNEGLNEFSVADIDSVNATTLLSYDVVILAQMALDANQVSMLTTWVTNGGNLIAMKPDKQLAPLLGLADQNSTLSNAYLQVNTSVSPGNGIVGETIQFHGVADRYTLNNASSIATLYSNATTPSVNPAVTLRDVGSAGGQAAAFTYDLATSIVYTHQGNPAWATQERDGFSPIRSDDKFFGNASSDPQADWVDLNKVAIPQADEQQRLLVNLILEMNKDKKPLPRFWYLPRGLKAAVIMTGDDHANNGTEGRFNSFLASSPVGCSVKDWECIRGTSYIFSNIDTQALTSLEAESFNAQGFEVGLHINTNCADFNQSQLETFYTNQINTWTSKYTNIPAPITQRHHCIAWSDWVTGAKVQLNHGIRFDTSYYFWPPSWVMNRPGFFSGTGMPMRFVDLDGTIIDVYQATSQMTDESGQAYPYTINTLLDNALDSTKGFFGAFTINAHTDLATITESTETVSSALARNVPVITSRQMLDWLDFRNNSSFSSINWSGNTLSFTVNQDEANANVPSQGKGLQTLLPAKANVGFISNLTLNGNVVPFVATNIKGVDYVTFAANAGSYIATYTADTTPPTLTGVSPAVNALNISPGNVVTATFSEAIDVSTINSSTFELRNASNILVPSAVSYNPISRTATLQPDSLLSASTVYTATIKGGAADPRVKDLSGNSLLSDNVWSFTTGALPCSTSCSVFSSATNPPMVADGSAVELGVKFKSDISGKVTGIRFYNSNTPTSGTYTASLWNISGGTPLATGTVTSTNGGWRQVDFTQPVDIAANTVYVASYHVPATAGGYAATSGGFNTAIDSAPLHFLQNGENGGNGVYAYSAGGVFPSDTFQATNYWVDVVFTTTVGPDTFPPTVTGQTPAINAAGIPVNSAVTATFSEPMDALTINTNTFELSGPAPANALVPASVSYNTNTRTVTLTPNSPLAESSLYTATVKGGNADPRVKDSAGNALAADFSWSFTTASTNTTGCSGNTESIWPNNPTPAIISDSDTASVELGVKFRSSTDGYICGIRYYKGSLNNGPHIGKLWNSSGVLLANATFQNETTSGWQSVYFSNPVQITANTQYVASYIAPVGRYSANSNYFSAGVTSGSLYAYSSTEIGGNGVYQYGAGAFPTNSFQSSNYWVDVIFTTDIGPDNTPPTVLSTQPAANSTGFIPINPVKAIFNEAMDPGSISNSTVELRGPGSTLVTATISYNTTERSAVITPSAALDNNTAYTAKVLGGTSGVKDVAGNALVSDYNWTFTTGVDPCTTGGNPIVCENSKTGNPSSEWDISGVGSTTIQGFATDISINRGQTVRFKINTPASDYRLDIYRMGYYNGNGARLVSTVQPSATLPQTQPACFNHTATGLIDCGNWTESASWSVPANATSGIYFAKAVREDGANAGLASHIFFIVRDDAGTSDILFQTADTTWQAYNNYGGNSFYTGLPAGRAYKVSYNRPFSTRVVDNGQDWVFNAEYPMVRWLEANGYNVSYFTGVDSDRFGSLIRNHRVFLSVGHDEYWSGQQRTNVELARDATTTPVNLVFLSGNEVFWKTRWENNITSSAGALGTESYRTLVCYKETHASAKIDPLPNVWTGTWRDPRFSPPADGGFPENELTGTLFMVNDGATTSIQVPEEDGKLRLWRNTSIANLTTGTTATLPFGTLGYEWDVDVDNGFRPAGLIRLSSTTVLNAPVIIEGSYGSSFGSGTAVHSLDMYKASSGAKVFGAGTVQWSWGLDSIHDRSGTPTSPAMQQATVNLLADMGVQPGTLQPSMILATASSDVILPNSVIASPIANASIAPNTTVNVIGSAADTGGRVAGVEVSINGGAWRPAIGRGTWSYSFTAPATNGTLTVRSRAIDDSLNMEIPGAGVTVTVGTGTDTTAPTIPQNIVATVISGTQVNLNWDDSTDNTAVTTYHVERCQGIGCTPLPAGLVSTTGLSAFNDVGLTEGVTYRYRISAGDAAGNFSAYSAIVTVTPDVTPPNAPTSLSAVVFSSTQVNLSWVASTDNSGIISGYRVERCQTAGCTNFLQIAASTSTSFADTGLITGANYSYRVRAVDAAGNLSPYSTQVSVTVTDLTAPSAPTALNAVPVGSTQVNVTWTASSDNIGVTGYRVERCQGVGCTNFAQIAVPTTTSFTDSGLVTGATYLYRVRATDAVGNLSAYSAQASVTISDTTAPSAPDGLSAIIISSSQINLSWTASTDNVGVTGYLIERCQGSGCVTYVQIGTTTVVNFSDIGLLAATTYQYRVRAIDGANNLSGYSNISSATTSQQSDTQGPNAPGNLSATAASPSQINLAWATATDNTGGSGVAGYRVERCQGAGCTNYSQIAALGIQTNYVDNGLTANTAYLYRVRAVDLANNLGSYSNLASATTQSAPPVTTQLFSPSANNAVTSSSGDNNGFQTTPTNAYADGGSEAIDTNSGTLSSTSCTSNFRDKHIFYNYGFNSVIPTNASVLGITVRLDARVDSTFGTPAMCVQLSWDGGVTWTNAKTTSTLSTAERTYLLGGSTDNWGRSWTPNQLTNANLRLRIIPVANSTSRDYSLDWVAVQVTYQ